MPSRMGWMAGSSLLDSSRPRSRLSTTASRSMENRSRANLCALAISCSARRRAFCASATARSAWSCAAASCSSSSAIRAAGSSPAGVAASCCSVPISSSCSSCFCSSTMSPPVSKWVTRPSGHAHDLYMGLPEGCSRGLNNKPRLLYKQPEQQACGDDSMLLHLAVNNYAIVDHLELELDRGMTVITGETGAGKSIMLDALALTLGDRADSGAVRPGADKADILATFDISDIPEAQQWLEQRDLASDEHQVILRRVVTAEGRSRGYINGSPCPQQDLKALGEMLIDIHSQHEHQSLLKTDTHRRLLDEYAKVVPLSQEVSQLARQWQQKTTLLERLNSTSEEQQARIQLLCYQLEELDALSLGDNELEQLEQEQQTLSQAGQLLEHCRFIIDLCSEGEGNTVLSADRKSVV